MYSVKEKVGETLNVGSECCTLEHCLSTLGFGRI